MIGLGPTANWAPKAWPAERYAALFNTLVAGPLPGAVPVIVAGPGEAEGAMPAPLLFALPDVETEELESWQENGEAWRRLNVTFPERTATHSAQQTFYFDRQGLLKRHDYDVDITGGTPAAHYVSAPTDVSGIVVPTKHRIFPRQPDGSSPPGPLVVSIDITDIDFA